MLVWLVPTALLVLVGVLFVLLYYANKVKKRWLNAAGIIVGLFVLFLAFYLPGYFFVSALNKLDPAATSQLTDSTTVITTSSETKPQPTRTWPVKTQATTARILPTVTPAPTKPPLDPASIHPDVLGLKDQAYPERPLFLDFNEVTRYILVNLLNNQFEMDFYLAPELAPDEGSGYLLLDTACATALSYYLFSAFSIEDMYTISQADGLVNARLKLAYTHPERDQQARQEALAFLSRHPLPPQGLASAAQEKAYARLIHDFIARKIIYAPIGFEPEKLQGLEKYAAFQEAYNVLVAPENEAVCAGYARAFALIAQYAGINAAYVYGNDTGLESHAWNVIYPRDGSEPVLIDVTWDDLASSDHHGQRHVADQYFYLPLSRADEHEADSYFADFLDFINE